MLNRFRYFLIITIISSIAFAFITNADPLQELLLKLEHFRKNYPQEKVHLHFDKPYYSIGDTIYFKAYIVNAEQNTLSDLSSIIYVDLINDQNEIKKSIRLSVGGGVATGDIGLTDSIREGNYRIRAYTNWMRNFNEEYFFNSTLAIGNALRGEIMATSLFSFAGEDSGERAEAIITFNFIKGEPVSNKSLGYTVLLDSKQLAKGNAITDEKGNVKISFTTDSKQLKGEIITNIKVDDKTITHRIPFIISPAKFDLFFFPEGGRLINGLATKIGFKAVDPNGLGIDITGTVVDDKGNKVAEFASAYAGIGNFYFTPFEEKNYFALIRTTGGMEKKIVLPKIEKQGHILSVDAFSDVNKLSIKIAANGPAIGKDVILIAQSNNIVHYTAKTKLPATGISTSLLKKRFPSGIIQFTLFDESYQPVAERLVFIKNEDSINVEIIPDKTSYTTREKVKISLDVKDEKGEAIAGTFSLAVTDENKVSSNELVERTIYTNLLLTSDLRGNIETPNYYFINVSPAKKIELDNLLLAQGWRRFVWSDIAAGKYQKLSFQVEKSLVVSGTVVTAKGEPVPGGRVSLLVKGSNGFIVDTVTNSQGRFLFDDLPFIDSAAFTIHARDSKGKDNVRIELDKNIPTPISANVFLMPNLFSTVSFATYIKNSAQRFDVMKQSGLFRNATMLEEVKVKTRKLTKVEEAVQPSSNLNGPGNADQIITYEDLKNCTDLGMCLSGKLTGVVLKPTGMSKISAFSTRALGGDKADSPGVKRPMLLIVDGMIQPSEVVSLGDFRAGDIQSIEVLRSGAHLNVYGPQGAAGVLVITTKRGNLDYYGLDDKSVMNGVVFGTSKGYHLTREFYSPDHSIMHKPDVPDLRSTIFWNPYITTGDDGKATIEFYNADGKGNYKLVVEGISANGKIARKVFYYTVN